MSERYFLRCLECHKDWGNRPSSICEDCLAPLAVVYDYDAIRREVTPRRDFQPAGKSVALF